ncbi:MULTISPECIES: 4-hydroxy-tetrahydrodipicolinate reductase [Leptospira]|uniref:4-hydroxy-tetrahydrodipicolinate reductase n=1 Tax=Leptospira kirschneri serovar Pomona TaxID=561005 RepID=A0A1T1DWP8_9LEPT|nr:MULTISPECIES: 4-hydroxy-tetrahydrodipicolinate reductase [Leptospira]EKP05820.1 dihydrodipicolinate reductase [Leptospira kirschneri str. 2008720114]EMJ89835.1 dihydrodipicolinate reductase [Leptospira kirschneri str. JB]EMK04513.1 dihydrodipicolinate reductase [Leptospira kirschneri]KXZ28281.1 4-hydroxy-tetrahydrodipicolinate reductase [Leptospira kirschneri]KXZ33827.1 4-hydroxy-tetrahydrodipicolinate reductase [Leptospira sp. ZV016]
MSQPSKTQIALIGASGRMGRAIISVLSTSIKSTLSSSIVSQSSVFLGMDSGLHSGIKQNGVNFSSDLEVAVRSADCVIDFSTHQNLDFTLKACIQHRKPVVIGTTGLTELQKDALQVASKEIGIVYSPNMSIGVNLLFKLTEIAAKVMGEISDIEIQDIHHRHKKDAPSGTAEKLKNILLETLGRTSKNVVHGRHGILKERDSKEIGIHTFRAGEVIGDHTVYFFTPEERIEITHKAQDRKTFAVGSVRAAEFLVGRKPGLYDMFAVLGL